jgi:hypothetical protein
MLSPQAITRTLPPIRLFLLAIQGYRSASMDPDMDAPVPGIDHTSGGGGLCNAVGGVYFPAFKRLWYYRYSLRAGGVRANP